MPGINNANKRIVIGQKQMAAHTLQQQTQQQMNPDANMQGKFNQATNQMTAFQALQNQQQMHQHLQNLQKQQPQLKNVLKSGQRSNDQNTAAQKKGQKFRKNVNTQQNAQAQANRMAQKG